MRNQMLFAYLHNNLHPKAHRRHEQHHSNLIQLRRSFWALYYEAKFSSFFKEFASRNLHIYGKERLKPQNCAIFSHFLRKWKCYGVFFFLFFFVSLEYEKILWHLPFSTFPFSSISSTAVTLFDASQFDYHSLTIFFNLNYSFLNSVSKLIEKLRNREKKETFKFLNIF